MYETKREIERQDVIKEIESEIGTVSDSKLAKIHTILQSDGDTIPVAEGKFLQTEIDWLKLNKAS